jgi:hypothetical protein
VAQEQRRFDQAEELYRQAEELYRHAVEADQQTGDERRSPLAAMAPGSLLTNTAQHAKARKVPPDTDVGERPRTLLRTT